MNALEFLAVDYRYPDGTQGLTACSLAIPAGETWGLIGPNGAGKTTFLMLADGLLKPSQGEVRVFGDPVSGSNGSAAKARQKVGIVFQNADDQVFCPTVFEDVVFGPLNHNIPPDEAHDRAHRALREVGLEGFENRVPQHLSGGEKRKVALATVLSMEPELILFDEPTTGLDPRGHRDLLELLNRYTQTLLIATHDFELVLRVCDQVALMDAGQVAVTDEPKEILFDKQLLEKHGLVQPSWLPAVASQMGLLG
jgi:cobalt/nickel transport system ATP-binding protein